MVATAAPVGYATISPHRHPGSLQRNISEVIKAFDAPEIHAIWIACSFIARFASTPKYFSFKTIRAIEAS